MLSLPRHGTVRLLPFRGVKANHYTFTPALTIHIVSMRFTIVFRHGQDVALRVRLGRRPVVVVSLTLNKECWNATLFIDNSESLAVPSIFLQRDGQQVVVG